MLPNEVKPYSESYQWLWKHRENYQEFRFNLMDMLVDDTYDKLALNCENRINSPVPNKKVTHE